MLQSYTEYPSVYIKKVAVSLLLLLFCLVSVRPAMAITSQETITVGETMRLYLPSYITSKTLKGCAWTSTHPFDVTITYQSNYSAIIKANNTVTGTCLIHCEYSYYDKVGDYTYVRQGYYDFEITVLPISPTGVSLPSTASLDVDERMTLTPTLTPTNAQTTYTWYTTNASIVSVWPNGNILARSAGTATITVQTQNGHTSKCVVTVASPSIPVASIELPSVAVVYLGKEATLSPTILPDNATDKSVSWKTTNSSIVSVDQNGNIKGIKEGSANISATSSNGLVSVCMVVCKLPKLVITDKEDLTDIPTLADVEYTRTFYQGWNSLCVPFAITQTMLNQFTEGIKIAIYEAVEVVGAERQVAVSQVELVDAGFPCFIYVPQDIECTFEIESATLVGSPNNSTPLKGSFVKSVIGKECYKLTSNGLSFGKTKTDMATITPFRVYITSEN